ncbi:MAG: riboflavin biosynthesis protein RibF, partial [Chloroflexi bacterium]|nr:riboflavin biosynthesis protein RibF [Chloroflexota bacterium]
MRIVRTLDNLDLERESVLTIGTFDGVHLGHQYVLTRLVSRARLSGRTSIALTFHPHPRAILDRVPVTYLSTPEERAELMAPLGVEVLVVMPFTLELAHTPARDFVRLLYDRLRMRELWVGADFAMGKNREGNAQRLQEWGAAMGYTCRTVEPLLIDGQPVSSTRIRDLLSGGQVEAANRLLGRPYKVSGPVVHGAQRGRSLGFRTANLRLPAERALPANGVYAVRVALGRGVYGGVANVGTRPSFGGNDRLLEVHLFHFEG